MLSFRYRYASLSTCGRHACTRAPAVRVSKRTPVPKAKYKHTLSTRNTASLANPQYSSHKRCAAPPQPTIQQPRQKSMAHSSSAAIPSAHVTARPTLISCDAGGMKGVTDSGRIV